MRKLLKVKNYHLNAWCSAQYNSICEIMELDNLFIHFKIN